VRPIYIPKPGTWFIPFIPVRCIDLYDDPRYVPHNAGLFEGWTIADGKPRRDEEICPLDEFWIIGGAP
jgi:hypothetical protein